jgi:hypothetical protein
VVVAIDERWNRGTSFEIDNLGAWVQPLVSKLANIGELSILDRYFIHHGVLAVHRKNLAVGQPHVA